MKLDQILKKPLITERSLQKVKESVYAFYVAQSATKHQVKAAATQLFGVEVAGVRTLTRPGKVRKTGRKMHKKELPDYKIAYIKVSRGKIDLFPQT